MRVHDGYDSRSREAPEASHAHIMSMDFIPGDAKPVVAGNLVMDDPKLYVTDIKGVLTLAEELAADRDKDLGLRRAIRKGQLEEVERLLADGADVNAAKGRYESTPLMLAAVRGDVRVLRLLLDDGADVNARDSDGWTALMGATVEGHLETVILLLDSGSNVDATNRKGDTALKMASAMNHSAIAKVFRERGAKE